MTVIREFGRVTLGCDACDDDWGVSHEPGDFDVLWADAKAAGWKAARENGEWRHRCADCVARGRRPARGEGAAAGDLFNPEDK